jgi:hypothetical protein
MHIAEPTLNSDTEATNLPPGLLDSPPHQPNLEELAPSDTLPHNRSTSLVPPPPLNQPDPEELASPANPDALSHICSTMLAPPPPSLLAALGVQPREENTGAVKRRSKRLSSQPPSNAKLVEHVRKLKLKKLGILINVEKTKTRSKKHKFLLAYTGQEHDTADAAVADLLGITT